MSVNLIISVAIDMRALSHKMDELILRKHQVDGTQLLIHNYYIHVYILPYFHQNKMIKFLGSLLQCI